MDRKEQAKAREVAEAWLHFFKREPKSGGIFNDLNILSKAVLALQKPDRSCGEWHLSYAIGGLASGIFVGIVFMLIIG